MELQLQLMAPITANKHMRRHPQEDGIMTPASANVFFQLSPTHVLENLLLDYVEIVKGSLQ